MIILVLGPLGLDADARKPPGDPMIRKASYDQRVAKVQCRSCSRPAQNRLTSGAREGEFGTDREKLD